MRVPEYFQPDSLRKILTGSPGVVDYMIEI